MRGEGGQGKSVGVIPKKKNGLRKIFTATNALSAYKSKVSIIEGMRSADGTRLCLAPVHFCDPGSRLFFASIKISNRIVAFLSQDAQIVLGLSESRTSPMLVSAKLKFEVE